MPSKSYMRRKLQAKKKFRNPDNLANPSTELRRLTNNRFQKRSGARAIAPHLNLENNTSHSFNVLVAGIRRLVVQSSGSKTVSARVKPS